jgi:hypothetical protein
MSNNAYNFSVTTSWTKTKTRDHVVRSPAAWFNGESACAGAAAQDHNINGQPRCRTFNQGVNAQGQAGTANGTYCFAYIDGCYQVGQPSFTPEEFTNDSETDGTKTSSPACPDGSQTDCDGAGNFQNEIQDWTGAGFGAPEEDTSAPCTWKYTAYYTLQGGGNYTSDDEVALPNLSVSVDHPIDKKIDVETRTEAWSAFCTSNCLTPTPTPSPTPTPTVTPTPSPTPTPTVTPTPSPTPTPSKPPDTTAPPCEAGFTEYNIPGQVLAQCTAADATARNFINLILALQGADPCPPIPRTHNLYGTTWILNSTPQNGGGHWTPTNDPMRSCFSCSCIY